MFHIICYIQYLFCFVALLLAYLDCYLTYEGVIYHLCKIIGQM